MKKLALKLTAIITVAFLLFPAYSVKAHPADLYAHTITIALSQTEMQIEWQLKPGFPDSIFTFVPPKGSKSVELRALDGK